MKLRQSPRLKDFTYGGPYAYNLTFVTRQRLPTFKAAAVAETCLESLNAACGRYGFSTLAYCFMPDHLHLLLAGREGSSLQDFARYFKQISSYRFKREHGTRLWQISYYDHVVQRNEDVEQIATYIWDNPVRAGLAESRLDYVFSGPRERMEQA
ncbi:MAG: transposase [Chloroflexi bacterium]|nr:transposase [Chloroflexota bacterium]